jgi:spermidine/putrescine-binding protein
MKKLLVLLVVAAFALSFMGCPAQDTSPKTLTIATPSFVQLKTDTKAAIERFKKNHPNVTIVLTTIDKFDIATAIPEWQANKTSYDLYISGTGSMLSTVIAQNWLEPMDEMLTGAMAKDKFVAGFLKEGYFKKADGKGGYFPMIPFLGEAAIIGVNTDVYKKAGMWKDNKPVGLTSMADADVVAYFKKLSPFAEQGAMVQIWDKEFIQYNYTGPILAMTGTFVDASGKGFDVSSAAAKQWLTTLQRLKKEGLATYTTTDTAGYDAWKTGKAGTFYAAQGHTMELVLSAGKPIDAIAYTSWPGAEKNGSIIWTHSVWIPKVSKNKDVAKQFIKEEVFAKAFQQWHFNNWGKLPVLKEAFGDGIQKYKEYMPLILSIADNSKSIPMWVDLAPYVQIFTKYAVAAAMGNISPDEALAKIKAESAGLNFTDMRAELK